MNLFSIKKNWFKLASASVLGFATIQVAAPAQATTLTTFTTTGADMAGMEVKVNFLGGGSETQIWSATGLESGGVTGSNWSLFQSGDSFDQPWILNAAQSISSLIINAIPGNAVFDIIPFDVLTPDSADGKPFSVQSGTAPTSFNYSVPIDISQGDLFGALTLNWSTGFLGQVTYLADTDTGTTDDPVTPMSVPEGNSILGLLTVGAFGAGSLLKRKQAQQTYS